MALNSLAALALTGLLNAGESRPRAVVNASRVGHTVCTLAIASRQLDHWPTQAEYADYWKISERKAQLQWALFRRAFPDEESPDRVARWVATQIGRHVEEAAAPLTVPAPPDLTPAPA